MPEAAVHVGSGKVRELYALDDERLLLVASDRISTFDVVLPTEIPDKGRVLTGLSAFWFARTRDICPNHLLALGADGRSTECRRLEMLPIECVVRGYLAGSGWKEYQQGQAVCGVALPPGLKNASRLPQAIYTPAAKAAAGEHDENITFERTVEIVGPELAGKIRDVSIALYEEAARIALPKGLIIADTKFEFGLDEQGRLVLMDEVLTPDSSRYWPAEAYQQAFDQGVNPPSFDKQFLRDWLEQVRIHGQPWDKTPPAPPLPPDVIARTAAKYREALDRLTA